MVYNFDALNSVMVETVTSRTEMNVPKNKTMRDWTLEGITVSAVGVLAMVSPMGNNSDN